MLKFDVKKLSGINTKINNIINAPLPYWFINRDNPEDINHSEKKMVIFFGNDMSGVLDLGIADKGSYISRVNKCLDYIRERFHGFDLCYRAHPADEKEQTFLDLRGFRVIQNDTTAEVFLSENLGKIRTVFTISSSSAFNAYNMGIDAHAFFRCFKDIYGQDFVLSLNCSLLELPESFFIENFSQLLRDNSRVLERDDSLREIFQKALDENKGKVWFYCSFSEHIVTLNILAGLIRDLSPGRKIGLIISHHRRWDRLSEYLNKNFNEVVFFPRVHYSLKPARLLQAINIARRVRGMGILPEDILVISSQPDFVEDCFVSYYKKNLKIGFTTRRDINVQYNPQSLIYTTYDDFSFNKATWFFNKIFEPLLGLHRSLFLSFTPMNKFYFNRYQRPINEIFDQLIVFHTPSREEYEKQKM
ncbi:MAG: hypothetical protein Q8Q06_04800 [bacterium]|nr:hypothetical protein [bacterium]